MTTQARVAVVLLTHHACALTDLPECYASLCAQSYPRDRWALFVVHNGVSKPIRQWSQGVAAAARHLSNASNLGWAGGNNTAIQEALRDGCEYLVLLNVDTVVEPDWLEELVGAASTHPALHIVQSKILLYGTKNINSLGNRIQYLGYGYCNGYGHPDTGLTQDAPVDFVSGAAMLVKREVFDTIGLFREDYFMYYDDLEFCWRARLAGFNLGVAPRSVCYHKYTFTTLLNFLFYLERNRIVTWLTLQKAGTLLVLAPCFLAAQAVTWAYFSATGHGRTVGRLLRYFLRPSTWAALRATRRRIGQLRVRADAELITQFAGTIVFAELDGPLLRYVVNPLLACYWVVARALIFW